MQTKPKMVDLRLNSQKWIFGIQGVKLFIEFPYRPKFTQNTKKNALRKSPKLVILGCSCREIQGNYTESGEVPPACSRTDSQISYFLVWSVRQIGRVRVPAGRDQTEPLPTRPNPFPTDPFQQEDPSSPHSTDLNILKITNPGTTPITILAVNSDLPAKLGPWSEFPFLYRSAVLLNSGGSNSPWSEFWSGFPRFMGMGVVPAPSTKHSVLTYRVHAKGVVLCEGACFRSGRNTVRIFSVIFCFRMS